MNILVPDSMHDAVRLLVSICSSPGLQSCSHKSHTVKISAVWQIRGMVLGGTFMRSLSSREHTASTHLMPLLAQAWEASISSHYLSALP